MKPLLLVVAALMVLGWTPVLGQAVAAPSSGPSNSHMAITAAQAVVPASPRPSVPPGVSIGCTNGTSGNTATLSVTLACIHGGSGIAVFMGWQDRNLRPLTVGDGVDTFVQVENQSIGVLGTTSGVAVYVTKNPFDHSMNVNAGSRTITASLNATSPDYSLYALEVVGYGFDGRIYVQSDGKSPGFSKSNNTGTVAQFADRPAPDDITFLPVVQSGAGFNAASPGTTLATLSLGAGTTLCVAYGLPTSMVGQVPVKVSWSSPENYSAPEFQVMAIPPIVAPNPTSVPTVGGSVNNFEPDYLFRPIGAYTSTGEEVFQSIPAGSFIVVQVHTNPGFAGASAYAHINVTDSQFNTYASLGRAKSGTTFANSADVEDSFAAKVTLTSTVEVKVVVQQFTGSTSFNLFFTEVVSTSTITRGTLATGGGSTGFGGGNDTVNTSGFAAGQWLAVTAGGMISASAPGSIVFTPIGISPTRRATPTQDTNVLPNFFQSSNAEVNASDTVGATWVPSSGFDTWAVATVPFGPTAPPPAAPSLNLTNVTALSFEEAWSNGSWVNVTHVVLGIANTSGACQAGSGEEWTWSVSVGTGFISQSHGVVTYGFNSTTHTNDTFVPGSVLWVALYFVGSNATPLKTACQMVVLSSLPVPPPPFDIFPLIILGIFAGLIVITVRRRKTQGEWWG